MLNPILLRTALRSPGMGLLVKHNPHHREHDRHFAFLQRSGPGLLPFASDAVYPLERDPLRDRKFA